MMAGRGALLDGDEEEEEETWGVKTGQESGILEYSSARTPSIVINGGQIAKSIQRWTS